MFKVIGLLRGDCDSIESHSDREVLQVDDLVTFQSLHLCPRCFLGQIKLRSKGKIVDREVHESVPSRSTAQIS